MDQVAGEHGGFVSLAGGKFSQQPVEKDCRCRSAVCRLRMGRMVLLYQQRRENTGEDISASRCRKSAAAGCIDVNAALWRGDNRAGVFQDADGVKPLRKIKCGGGQIFFQFCDAFSGQPRHLTEMWCDDCRAGRLLQKCRLPGDQVQRVCVQNDRKAAVG